MSASAAPIELAGQRMMLDPGGALYWPKAGVLAVADLHLEKGSAAARRGQLVPPYDTALTLGKLTRLLRRWSPRMVVALGDSFHDAAGSARMMAGDAARLANLAASVPFVWVLGNHDPVPPVGLPGEAVGHFVLDGITFRHEALPGAKGEISGHFHPKASIETRAGRVTRPCFVSDGWRVVLPPLGAYAGGLEITHPAIAGLFPRGGRAFLLGTDRLFSFAFGPTAAAAAGGRCRTRERANMAQA